MDGADIAVAVASAVAAVAVLLLLALAVSVARALRELRVLVDDLRREAQPTVAALRAAAREAESDLSRARGLLATAESVSHTVDSASRLAYRTFSSPAVKAVALGAGVARAGRRLRSGSGPANGSGRGSRRR